MNIFKKYLDYLRDNPNNYWFKRKWYGWGWTPAKWQGWAVVLVYIVLLVRIFVKFDRYAHSASDTLYSIFLPFVLLTAVLIVVCYWKGESPRWQWGPPKL